MGGNARWTDATAKRTALPRKKKQAALIVIESYGSRPLSQSVWQWCGMMKGAAAEEFFKAEKG